MACSKAPHMESGQVSQQISALKELEGCRVRKVTRVLFWYLPAPLLSNSLLVFESWSEDKLCDWSGTALVLNTAPSRFHVKLISTTQYWHFPDSVAQKLQPTIRCERYRSLQCTDTTQSILKVLFVRTYCKLNTCVNKTFTTRRQW